MEPVTAIALASFVYSVYSSFSKSSARDPLDAVVALLVEVNKKLGVINDKLNIIYDEIVQLPDKVEYKRRVNDLIIVTGRMPVLYNKLASDIDKAGSESKGKRNFIEKNRQDITDYLTLLRNSTQVLKTETDVLSVALLAQAAQNDYELCRLIHMEEPDIKIEQNIYLNYLRNAIWLDPLSLEMQIKDAEARLNSVIFDSMIVDWRFKICVQPGAHEDPAVYQNERFINLHKPNFVMNSLDDSQKQIVKTLSSFGYFDAKIFANVVGYGYEKVASIPIEYNKKIFKLKKEISFSNNRKPRITENEHIRNAQIGNYIAEQAKVYDRAQNTLLALCSAHNLAVTTVKYINLRVL